MEVQLSRDRNHNTVIPLLAEVSTHWLPRNLYLGFLEILFWNIIISHVKKKGDIIMNFSWELPDFVNSTLKIERQIEQKKDLTLQVWKL